MGVVTISGQTRVTELTRFPTLLARVYQAETAQAILTDLFSGTLWTFTLDAAYQGKVMDARFDGISRWEAIYTIVRRMNLHIREDLANRHLTIGPFGSALNVLLTNGNLGLDYRNTDNVGIIQEFSAEEDSANIINSIIPLGAGEGINAFTMQWSTRSIAQGYPYDVLVGQNPDGSSYYYLEDTASVQAYGRRQVVMKFDDITPIAQSPVAFESASNALFDVAATTIIQRKDPVKIYNVKALFNRTIPIQVGGKLDLDYAEERIENEPVVCTKGNATLGKSSTSSLTFSHVNDANYLIVLVSSRNGPVTSLTFDGRPLTKVISSGTAFVVAEIWELRNAPQTNGDVVVNNTGNGITAHAISVFNGGSIRDSDALPTSFRTSSSLVVTSNLGTDLVLDILTGPDGGAGSATPFAGQTQIFNDHNSAPQFRSASSYEAGDSAILMGWNHSNEEWGYAAVSIAPALSALSNRGMQVEGSVVVLEKKVNYQRQGPSVDLTLSDRAEWMKNDVEVVIGQLQTLAAARFTPQLSTIMLDHASIRGSVQQSGSKWFRYRVRYTDFTHLVHGFWLDFNISGLLSNTTGASAGGATTSNVSGQEVSSASVSHSHGVSGFTSQGGSSHAHGLNTNIAPGTRGAITEVQPEGSQFESPEPHFTDGTGAHSGWMMPSGGDHNHTINHGHWYDHLHRLGEHNHFLQAGTSFGESGHSHFVSSHSTSSGGSHDHNIPSHSHTISNHTHALVYGVFQDSLPNPATTHLYVNGVFIATYTNGQNQIDLTEHLVTASGQPLRQESVIEFRTTASKAYDVEAHGYSLVSISHVGRGTAG